MIHDLPQRTVLRRSTPASPERPDRAAAEAAVRTLLAYVGENPDREGLLETPARVVRAYDEFFAGYEEDPEVHLRRTFEEVEGYDELVLVRDIEFVSYCEHHMVAFPGKAHVAYLPQGRVVGLSKLGRVVDVFAKRLQIQEKLTVQIAEVIERVLQPRGVAVQIEAKHHCMAHRGVQKPGSLTVTRKLLGAFRDDATLRAEFLQLVQS